MKNIRSIPKGLYLVLDPSMERDLLLKRLQAALEGGVQLLQIWNNWPPDFDLHHKRALIDNVVTIANPFHVLVLINEDWELLQGTGLSGVHFDQIPADFDTIRKALQAEAVIGITCGNDLRVVEWAEQQRIHYISFCAMFPSSSAVDCEIVTPETIQKARDLTNLPLFVSGGITPENMSQLEALDIAGVAVISGILSHEHPKSAALIYSNNLKKFEK
ncbi:MAG TPA: thiamine phosphate synthase [Cyclobacteriaceae bacterium]|nr:thiamine phosphate synthase [Cyclobacteriaceae bacterium]